MRTQTFPGRYDMLVEIGEFVRTAAEDAGLENFAVYSVETAVDEACTNIIEHNYQGEDVGDICCSVEINSDNLTIILQDSGEPFDPSTIPDPDVTAPLEERDGHGLGIFFIRRLMDSVQFKYIAGRGNSIIMVKHKENKEE